MSDVRRMRAAATMTSRPHVTAAVGRRKVDDGRGQ